MLLLLVIIHLTCTQAAHEVQEQATVGVAYVDYVEQCQDASAYIFQAQNLRVSQRRYNFFVFNGNAVITEPITGSVWYMVHMVRCILRENPDTCEFYSNVKFDSVCENLDKNMTVWSKFYSSIQGFKRSCPMQPGNYSIVESEVDMTSMAMLPTSVGYWKLRITMENATDTLKCIQVFVKVIPKRFQSRRKMSDAS